MKGSGSNHDFQVLKEMAGCLCLNLRKTTRLITRYYDHALEPVGLRITQLILLGMVAMAKTAPVTHLAKSLAMDRTTFSRDLEPLARERLVETSPGNDRRVRMVALTPRGERLLLGAIPYWQQAHRRVIRHLDLTSAKVFMNQLESINKIIQQHNPAEGEGGSHEK